MTVELLRLVKEKGWSIDNDRNYIIDITGWNDNLPMFSLPIRHFNMSDHQKSMEKFLETEDSVSGGVISHAELLRKYHDLVNKKIKVNIAILEVVLFANMLTNAENEGSAAEAVISNMNYQKSALREIYEAGSMGALMAFQGHKRILSYPEQFVNKTRPNHIFDWLLMPKEVYDYKYHGVIYD